MIMYLLYNSFGFTGIYIFTLLMSGAISFVLFNNLLIQKNGLILSFIITMIATYFSKGLFAARNQVFSFLIFELEIYSLNGLLERGKKKYFYILLILAFLLVNFHDTVYILFFVMIMPYLGEVILKKLFKLENSDKFEYSNLSNIKYLIILVLLAIGIGFLTPIFGTAYTNIVNCMSGVSTEFIGELQPVNLVQNLPLTFIAFLTIGIICFTKTKIKIKDLLFVFGFLIFSLIANRNIFFMYLIGIIYFTNIIKAFLNSYIKEENQIFIKLENSKIFLTILSCFTLIYSIYNISGEISKEYVHDLEYPKLVTDWILKNVDYKNMRIWNGFNFGSYLELNGIKVFLDSRSGMYTEEENPKCTVLKDWLSVINGEKNYQEIFDKYNITHVLVSNDELINKYIYKDENYNLIYDDDLFSLYEKK